MAVEADAADAKPGSEFPVREVQVELDVPVLRVGYLGAAGQILGQE
jgi:hypothetical protein